MRMDRCSGILLHPSSLPGPFGIGELGKEALAFLEGLAEAGQRLWQVLPLGPTGYGDSPYAPLSTYAGNELLISLSTLLEEGLLEWKDVRSPPSFSENKIDYGVLIPWKRSLLLRAASIFLEGAPAARRRAFADFKASEASWLADYALFMAIKADYDERARREGRSGGLWNTLWPKTLALREPQTIAIERERRAESIELIEVLQFFFAEQWARIKTAAHGNGIRVIGDLPIFLALDSAEVWTRRELFLLDEEGNPREVAGVPPDYFCADGQLWGNPLYDWHAHREEKFAWWGTRLRASLSRYDVLRIDHFRGLESCWAVPAGEKTARRGQWKQGPGLALFENIQRELGEELPFIAEDLGFITDEVRLLRDRLGLPGMRILQFAFDATESGQAFDPSNGFLPHNYVKHTVAYTGTHDNDTITGWYAAASPAERAYLESYLGYKISNPAKALIKELLKSIASWTVIPMQDVLGLGSEARMNTPSTLGGNWTWRMRTGDFSAKQVAELRELTRLYGRLG